MIKIGQKTDVYIDLNYKVAELFKGEFKGKGAQIADILETCFANLFSFFQMLQWSLSIRVKEIV